jgi:hypothetical protein
MCPWPRFSRQQSQGVMDWPLYQSIVEEFSRLGRSNHFKPVMTYCYMGEPFLLDNLHRYVQFAVDKNISVYLNTNASVMTPSKVDALLDSGFKGRFFISFHGITPAVYERITGLDYQRSLNHIFYLLDQIDPQRVLIRGVDDHWPEGERQRWYDYWKKLGVQIEYLDPISRCGSIGRLLPKRIRVNNRIRLYGCRDHLPLVEMVILYDGRAVMCCQDMGREMIWGSVADAGVAGVWNGPDRRRLLEQLYHGDSYSKDFICARCERALGMSGMIQSVIHEGWRKLKRSTLPDPAAIL